MPGARGGQDGIIQNRVVALQELRTSAGGWRKRQRRVEEVSDGGTREALM